MDLTELITSVANDLGRVRNEPVDVYNPGTTLPDGNLSSKAYDFADMVSRLINGGDIVLIQPLATVELKPHLISCAANGMPRKC